MQDQLKASVNVLENLRQSWLDSQVTLQGQNCDIDLGEHLTNVLGALAATPAPLADAELAELQKAYDAVAEADKAWQAGTGSQKKWNAADDVARNTAYRLAHGLLARVAAAEARLTALDKAYEVANSYDDNVDGYPHSWAVIKYGFDNAPTVKGGQPHA